MTSPEARPVAVPIPDPLPDTPVLLHRTLNPAADPATFSVYAHDRWNLTPGFFESHAVAVSLNFMTVPPQYRVAVKRYFWCLINADAPRRQRGGTVRRLALTTIRLAFGRFLAFVQWLHANGIQGFGEVRREDLERYHSDLLAADVSSRWKRVVLGEVARFWGFRMILPEDIRMLAAPSWEGEDIRDLPGASASSGVNRTPRINTDTIDLLLMWALRFVNDFSHDITTAFHDHLSLWRYGPGVRDATLRKQFPRQRLTTAATQDYLERLRVSGGTLPGRRTKDGELEIDYNHLIRILQTHPRTLVGDRADRHLRTMIEHSGLVVSDHVPVGTPITGVIDGAPWRQEQIGYAEARPLAELLRTACFIVIAYLSGMRSGEALNLQRGCVSHDPASGIWMIEGLKFKGAVDGNGEKIPEGEIRADPWVVVEEAARAVDVLEHLHDQPLLFPNQLNPSATYGDPGLRPGHGRTSSRMAEDVAALVDWVNAYARENGRGGDVIPPDPEGPIRPSRFRRTLAWHIVRKPRGLIAGAIQYGHVHVRMTLGYSGSYHSGFPDEKAFEDWLYRLELLGADYDKLRSGERVSGPAAPVYRSRVEAAHHKFGGRVLKNTQQAKDMLANPLLQVFPGRAMTCVFDPDKALCQIRTSEGDKTVTPDQTDCRPNCRNKAYTDRDIAALRHEVAELQAAQTVSLAPSPRRQRLNATIERLQEIIDNHEGDNPGIAE
jgi:integrase